MYSKWILLVGLQIAYNWPIFRFIRHKSLPDAIQVSSRFFRIIFLPLFLSLLALESIYVCFSLFIYISSVQIKFVILISKLLKAFLWKIFLFYLCMVFIWVNHIFLSIATSKRKFVVFYNPTHAVILEKSDFELVLSNCVDVEVVEGGKSHYHSNDVLGKISLLLKPRFFSSHHILHTGFSEIFLCNHLFWSLCRKLCDVFRFFFYTLWKLLYRLLLKKASKSFLLFFFDFSSRFFSVFCRIFALS